MNTWRRVMMRLLAFVLLTGLWLTSFGTVAWAETESSPESGTSPDGLQLGGPELRSSSLVLIDAGSGHVLFEKNPHEKRHPASVTKVMTLSVAYDAIASGRIGWEDEAQTSPEAKKLGGTTVFLEAGERVTIRNLMRAVAIASANDAAYVLAEHVAGSESAFAELMNEKAARLGMKNSHFVNAHGLDNEQHYTTAYDLALLSRHVAQSQPELLEFTRIFHDYFEHNNGRRTDMANFNRLVTLYDGADGLKTGFTTKAGYTLAATAKRGETRLVATVMGAPTPVDRQNEAVRLLNFGFANYVTVPIAPKGTVFADVQVLRGLGQDVAAVLPDEFALTQRKGEQQALTQTVELESMRIAAPVQAGQLLGHLVVQSGEDVIRVPLVAAADVPRASAMRLFWRFMTGAFW